MTHLAAVPGRLAVALLVTTVMAGCASSGAVPQPFPRAGVPPASAPASPATPASPDAPAVGTTGSAEGIALTSTALSLRGAPYRNGGSAPSGFDCSGFVQYVFGQHGVTMPRETREQFRVGRRVSRDDLEAGDLVFFTTVAPGASHVGIVIGDDQFVHAPSSNGVVRVERLSSSYWHRRFVGARRPR